MSAKTCFSQRRLSFLKTNEGEKNLLNVTVGVAAIQHGELRKRANIMKKIHREASLRRYSYLHFSMQLLLCLLYLN